MLNSYLIFLNRTAALLFTCHILSSGIALAVEPNALPQGGQVVSGNANIAQAADNHLVIDQQSAKAAINWDSFNVGAQAHVEFKQPSADTIALNRVVGSKMSEIMGKISAPGNVFLINPNGIVVGKNASIDVGGLVASTHDLSNKDFNDGNFSFSTPAGNAPAGHILNEGTITVKEGGIAAFVAPSMHNAGLIHGKVAKVALAAGEAVTVDFYGDDLIKLAVVDQPVTSTPQDTNGEPVRDLIKNTGTIAAEDGGYVLFTVQAARDIVDHVINNDGIVAANSVRKDGGRVIFEGGTQGSVSQSGTIEATSQEQNGGQVGVFAEHIRLPEGTIRADGGQNGGEILLGGNFQGKSAEVVRARNGQIAPSKGQSQVLVATHNAKSTIVSEAATLSAASRTSAPESTLGQTGSRGGKIIVWSDQTTHFKGSLDVRGVSGGFIEVSAKEATRDRDFIFSPKNRGYLTGTQSPGILLLDPKNIAVISTTNSAYTAVAGSITFPSADSWSFAGGDGFGAIGEHTALPVDPLSGSAALLVATDQSETTFIQPATLTGLGGNVILQAANDIWIAESIDLTDPGTGFPYDFIAQAGRSIYVEPAVTIKAARTALYANDCASLGDSVDDRGVIAGDRTPGSIHIPPTLSSASTSELILGISKGDSDYIRGDLNVGAIMYDSRYFLDDYVDIATAITSLGHGSSLTLESFTCSPPLPDPMGIAGFLTPSLTLLPSTASGTIVLSLPTDGAYTTVDTGGGMRDVNTRVGDHSSITPAAGPLIAISNHNLMAQTADFSIDTTFGGFRAPTTNTFELPAVSVSVGPHSVTVPFTATNASGVDYGGPAVFNFIFTLSGGGDPDGPLPGGPGGGGFGGGDGHDSKDGPSSPTSTSSAVGVLNSDLARPFQLVLNKGFEPSKISLTMKEEPTTGTFLASTASHHPDQDHTLKTTDREQQLAPADFGAAAAENVPPAGGPIKAEPNEDTGAPKKQKGAEDEEEKEQRVEE